MAQGGLWNVSFPPLTGLFWRCGWQSKDGFLWEEGPNTFQPTRQIMRLAVDVGLKDELVFADHTLPRCVYWEGKLFPLPSKLEDAPFFQLLNPLEKIIAGILSALPSALPCALFLPLLSFCAVVRVDRCVCVCVCVCNIDR